MTLDQLYSKWVVGTEMVQHNLVMGESPPVPLEIKMRKHNAPLGDFLRDYIDHKNIPRWKREWDWKLVEQNMREYLNKMCIVFHSNL